MPIKSSGFFPRVSIVTALIIILAVVFLAYSPVLKADFVKWDDDVHLLDNITIRSLDREHIQEMFTTTVNKIYIPLTNLSFALEYHFFGYNPFVYHLNNLLLHLGVTALVFAVGLRLSLSMIGAGAAALLFGIHPMHVESVAWVTERKDVLYAFFYMLAVLSYLRYLDKKALRALVLTTGLGALSMLAKPMALSLPLILLLLDWFKGRPLDWRVITEKIPVSVLIAAITLITYLTHARVPGRGIFEGALIWSWTFVFYLRQFVFSFFSVPIYLLAKPVSLSNPEYALSVTAALLVIWSVVRFRRHRWFLFATAYYFFSIFFLLRYDDVKDTNIVADRFMYLPSLGFCFLLGVLVESLKRKFQGAVVALGVVALMAVSSLKTYQLSQVWKDSLALWQHQINVFPNQDAALNNLATVLRDEEQYQQAEKEYKRILRRKTQNPAMVLSASALEAVRKVNYIMGLYQKAIEANPKSTDARYNLGKLYSDLGYIAEAVDYYKQTLMIDYEYKDAHFGLGDLYREAGDYAHAVFAYDQALRFHADDVEVYFNVINAYTETLKKKPEIELLKQSRENVLQRYTALIHQRPPRSRSFFNLGVLFYDMGDLARARMAYETALEINPNQASTLYNLANVLSDAGQISAALTMYQTVMKMNPKMSTDVLLKMAVAYGRQGQTKEAREYAQKAVAADPQNAQTYFSLGFIYETMGNLPEAVGAYQKSVEIDPSNPEVYYNLGNVYVKLEKPKEAVSFYLKAVKQDPLHMDTWVNLSILAYQQGDFANAVTYCDEAILLGYEAPADYLKVLEPYRQPHKS